MVDQKPIGIFDSGVGGLSIWREIVRQAPQEDTIYVADQAHVPYGGRSLKEVRQFSEAITRFLLDQGTKIIVIACNTASAAALYSLRRAFSSVPFVGMEPAVKPAVERSRSGVVAVIATKATFQGELFASLLERYAQDVEVITKICPGLVGAVEAGALDAPETERLLLECLMPLVEARVDQVVLGCTHYPFLQPAIESLIGEGVTVIDPAPAVARQTRRVLAQREVQANREHVGRHVFFTSGDGVAFERVMDCLVPRSGERRDVREVHWRGPHMEARPVRR